MSATAVRFRCHGCGAVVDPAAALPFRCPAVGQPADEVDHLLAPEDADVAFPGGGEEDPFLRDRALLSPYRLARQAGLPDAAWADVVGRLDEALVRVDGRGFRVTPMAAQPALARAAGIEGPLFAKDETGNVAGSHKARHLMGVLLYLRVLEEAGLPAGEGLRKRRLAIASCGNAALAASVVARAADWPIDVFIPPSASPAVVRRLRDLGATIAVCERRSGEAGDPTFLRFGEAVARGAIPFGVQGTMNGLAVEGARTLAFEMVEWLAGAGAVPRWLYVQVGGGALASALSDGFAIAAARGVLPSRPSLVAVQTEACAPLERAFRLSAGVSLGEAARHRPRYMWPWDTAPESVADGILDDETYDWWSIVRGMRESGGRPVVVGEETLKAARDLVAAHTGVRASATGTSGLAGVLATRPEGGVVVVLSGVER